MWNRLGYLSEESVSDLNRYFDDKKSSLPRKEFGNVISARRLSLVADDDSSVLSAALECYHMMGQTNLKPYDSYVLEYYEGSYTAMHVDGIGDSKYNSLTTITLLNKSEDLSGGNILIRDDEKDLGAMTVLHQSVGEMISYSHRVPHGVSKVLKGTRRVLVNWYELKG